MKHEKVVLQILTPHLKKGITSTQYFPFVNAGRRLHRCALSVYGPMQDGCVMSVPGSMNVAGICSCRWLIPRELGCVDIQVS